MLCGCELEGNLYTFETCDVQVVIPSTLLFWSFLLPGSCASAWNRWALQLHCTVKTQRHNVGWFFDVFCVDVIPEPKALLPNYGINLFYAQQSVAFDSVRFSWRWRIVLLSVFNIIMDSNTMSCGMPNTILKSKVVFALQTRSQVLWRSLLQCKSTKRISYPAKLSYQ